MSPLRVLRGFIFGAIGGLVGWILVEFLPFPYPFQPARFEEPGSIPPQTTAETQALLGIALGVAIGGFLGIAEGIAEGTAGRFKRALAWFLGLGVVGGYVGLYFGQLFYGWAGGNPNTPQLSAGDFIPQLFARGLAWMFIGLFLGLALGAPNLSFRRMWNGAVGGAIGGFLGGVVFQLMAFTQLFYGPQARFVGFTILGGVIGFFINLIAEALKRVWVKVLVGRNEGREHVIDTPVAYVGRDELADVPVFLDPAVPKRMASFRLENGRYTLHPESRVLQIAVNGQPLAPGQVLRDGDAIQFGRVTLAYNEKATASGSRRPVDTIPLADLSMPSVVPGATPIPTSGNVCEFCGHPRDAATGACACSVPDYAPAGAYPAGYEQPAYDYGAGDGYGYGAGDPAYGATVMEPAGYAPSASGPQLVAIQGPYAGQVFPLAAAEIGIGRDPSQDLPLSADTTTSRRHARILSANGTWILRDEGSANGTYINGNRVQEQALFPGDTIRIGANQFRFEG